MASASFVEIIAHFAGYLRIFDDVARDRIEYDETLAPRPSDDYTTLRPHYDHPVIPDDIDILPSPAPDRIPDDPDHFARAHPIKALKDLPAPEHDVFPPSPAPNILLPMPGGGGGGAGGGDFHVKVQYQPGDGQSEVE